MSDYKGKIVFDQEQHSFFPKTYSDSVLFPDNQTLQDKYENNLLVDIKKLIKITVLENTETSYRLQFGVGDNIIVTPNLIPDTGYTHTFTEMTEADIDRAIALAEMDNI